MEPVLEILEMRLVRCFLIITDEAYESSNGITLCFTFGLKWTTRAAFKLVGNHVMNKSRLPDYQNYEDWFVEAWEIKNQTTNSS